MMARAHAPRLRAAIFMGFADVFIGAAGLVLALIVLSSSTEEPRANRLADVTATCSGNDPAWTIHLEQSPPLSIDAWIALVGQAPELLVRVGVFVAPDQMRCFQRLDRAVRLHNRSLADRDTIAAAIALIWLPNDPSDDLDATR